MVFRLCIMTFSDINHNTVFAIVFILIWSFLTQKVYFELLLKYRTPETEQSESKLFNTKKKIITGSDDLEVIFNDFKLEILTKTDNFSQKDSGWGYNINKYIFISGRRHLKLLRDMELNGTVLNIYNNVSKCFAFDVNAGIFKPMGNRRKTIHHIHQHLILKGIEFPVDEPLHFTKLRWNILFNLLLIHDDSGNNHFCWLKDLLRLVNSQRTKYHGKRYICDGYL